VVFATKVQEILEVAGGVLMILDLMFRGDLPTQDVDKELSALQQKQTEHFVEWIPSNIKSSIINTPPATSKISCTFVANTTALKGIFQRLATQFGAMYRRKAFLHWYKGEGMDEMEFQEADKNVRDLITEYQDKQDAQLEEDEEESEDDDI
jgi:tubulin beta